MMRFIQFVICGKTRVLTIHDVSGKHNSLLSRLISKGQVHTNSSQIVSCLSKAVKGLKIKRDVMILGSLNAKTPKSGQEGFN